MHLLQPFFTFLLFSFLSYGALAQNQMDNTRFNTSVLPITKAAETPIYNVRLEYLSYLIDLDAPFTWRNCILKVPPVPCAAPECILPISCRSSECLEARSYVNPLCPSLNITAKYGCSICAVTPVNPVAKICKISQLTSNWLYLSGTDGRNPSTSRKLLTYFTFSCAPESIMVSLPKDVSGVAAFSSSALAFPRQLSHLNVAKKFALCLPSSSSATGVAFLGDGPFYLLPFSNLDVRSILSYTILRNVSKSLGYYIGLNSISVDGKRIPSMLAKGSFVKLSTVVPYTTLRTDIYKAFIASFSKATKTIPRAKAVKPFTFCLKSSSIRSTRTGLEVPKIDFELESGKNWTVYGGNSMMQVGKGVACLGFVDGGEQIKEAIVIGSFQMENNFLFFDMEKLRFGFSSSLLARGTSCGNFNFTTFSE